MSARGLLLGVVIVLLAAYVVAAAPGGPVEIRIGHGFAAEEQLWLMAARPDLAPNFGKAYTLKLTAFRANADRLAAYEAGQLDGGTIAGPTALFAAEQGVPMRLVASLSREVTGGNWFNTTYLALADSGIRTPADLRGKTIGIVDFKSATDLWARAAVATAGLDPDRDVKYVVIPFPAMGEALRSRRIDVGAFPQPFWAIEKSRGGIVDVFTSKTGVPFDEELILLFVRPEFIERNHDAMRAFIRDLAAATRWYLSNTRDARQALIDARFVLTPPAVYLGMQDWYREPTARISLEALRRVQEFHLKFRWQTKPVDLRKLINLSLLPY